MNNQEQLNKKHNPHGHEEKEALEKKLAAMTTEMERMKEALHQKESELRNTQSAKTQSEASNSEEKRTEEKEGKSMEELAPEEALEEFAMDPVGFIASVLKHKNTVSLYEMKEQAELEGALRQFRREHPDASRFEKFIIEEAGKLIQNDPDGVIEPWGILFEKALKTFEENFRETVRNNPELLKADVKKEGKAETRKQAYVEGAVSRKMPEESASFTREQIGKMSLKEFLKNEALINEALESGRIR